jgi:hypothetical protein
MGTKTTVHENGSLTPKEKGASPVDLYIYLNRKFKTCLFAQDSTFCSMLAHKCTVINCIYSLKIQTSKETSEIMVAENL